MQRTGARLIQGFVLIIATTQVTKEPSFKITIRMGQVIIRQVTHTHHYAAPVTDNRPCRVLGVKCGCVPIAADDCRERQQGVEMVQNYLYLFAAMGTRTMRVEVHGNSAKTDGRMLDIGDDRTKIAEPTF